MAELRTRPLQQGLPFGIRIAGVTREQLRDASTRARIEALFAQQGMIVFEDVEQSDAMQLAISACFGPLKEHPVKSIGRVDSERLPGVIEIRTEPGGGVVEINGVKVAHWQPWHFDHCYNNELNRAAVLRPVRRTEEGGLTGFLDGVTLYQQFPKDLLARIEGEEIVYHLSTNYDDLKFGKPQGYRMIASKHLPPGFKEQAAAMPRAIHPAVWTRPAGERCLHVSPYMSEGILGQESAQGDALLEEVSQAINQLAEEYSYRHQWAGNEMIVWDNLRMLHCTFGHDPLASRLMYRTTIKGDYGLGRWGTESTARNAASSPA
jgi:taurine dioxygenase